MTRSSGCGLISLTGGPWPNSHRMHTLSRSRLGGLFVEQFGVPPIALLARLREMARLLRESDMTIAEIGVRVGWRNRGHAAEQFAKIMGVTPTAYRAEYRQRTQPDGRRPDRLLVVRTTPPRHGR